MVSRRRLAEYTVKAGHLAGRYAHNAPEQRHARRMLARSEPPPPSNGQRVAILTMRDWALHVQWEAMLAHALRARGADVQFITCGGGLDICDRANTWESPPTGCASCTRYVSAALESHDLPSVSLRRAWEQNDPGAWPELDEMTLADLAGVEADGLPLGDLCQIPVAWFLMRTDYQNDPIAPATWRDFLRSARRIAFALRETLDRMQPDVVVVLNGLFLFEAIAWAICRDRGIDVVTYERGFIKGSLSFRRNEVAAHLRLDDVWPEFADVALTVDEEETLDQYIEDRRLGRRTMDRYWDNVDFVEHDRPDGALVAMFPNITWDSAVIGRVVAFETIQDWISTTIEYFADRPSDRLVIRFHPAEVKLAGKRTRESLARFVAERYPELPPNVQVIDPSDNSSSYDLMRACDVGLVFTSTTGLELALAGKPVIVAGKTHYRGKGFTHDADSPESYTKLLDAVVSDPGVNVPDLDLARRYAYLFFFRTPIPVTPVVEHVPALARWMIEDLGELAPGRNPDIDRICDGVLGLGDFLPHAPSIART